MRRMFPSGKNREGIIGSQQIVFDKRFQNKTLRLLSPKINSEENVENRSRC